MRLVLVLVTLLLVAIPSHAVIFCCNDTQSGQFKCWSEGKCCILKKNSMGGLPEGWYLGCDCNEIGGCPTDETLQCSNETGVCCPVNFAPDYMGIKGYYCSCSDATNCRWIPFNRSASIWFSNSNPNLGEVIYAYLNASYEDGGKRRHCHPGNAELRSFKVNEMERKDYATWNSSLNAWQLPINTSQFTSAVEGTLYITTIDAVVGATNSYDVNFPPEISDVMIYPNPVDVDSNMFFNATVTDPDLGDSVDRVLLCDSVSKEGISWKCNTKLCELVNVANDHYSCALPASVFGTGTHEVYIWANDTSHGLANVSGPHSFDVRQIYVGRLEFSGNTGSIVVSGSGIEYDNGTSVNGYVTCWLNERSDVNCSAQVNSGSFSNCMISSPYLQKGSNTLTCVVEDQLGLMGNGTTSFNFNGIITSFDSTTNTTIGQGDLLGFSTNFKNTGDIEWGSNVVVEVLYYPITNPNQVNLFCLQVPRLIPEESRNFECSKYFDRDPGKYAFFSRIRYIDPEGNNLILSQSDIIEITVLRVDVELTYIGLDYGAVLPCTNETVCDANYTRGDLMEVLVKAKVWTTPYYYIDCDGSVPPGSESYCEASFSMDGGDWIPLPWTAANAWKLEADTSLFTCDFHSLRIKVTHAGVNGIAESKFYVSCVPRVTVVPLVARVVLGSGPTLIFNVSVKNPTDETKHFDLELMPDRKLIGYVKWVVNGANLEDFNLSDIEISPISSKSFAVNLTSAPRGGTYEMSFRATDKATLDTYEAKGTLIIFSESLDELLPYFFPILLLVAIFLYSKRDLKSLPNP